MEVPQIKLSNSVLIGIAVGAAILAIVLFYENQSMRKQIVGTVGTKKPCGCQENQTFPTQRTAPPMKMAGVHDSVFTGRLDSAPMPAQSPNDPEHPPEVVL